MTRSRTVAVVAVAVGAVAVGAVAWWVAGDEDAAVDAGPATTTTAVTTTTSEPESTSSTSTSTASTTTGSPTTAVPTTTTGGGPSTASISFTSIGGVRIGDVAPRPTGEEFDNWKCGYWEPDDALFAVVVEGDDGIVRVSQVKTDDPGRRTTSGVGVGTDLATLQRTYGDRLVVDRADGWDRPTDGLLASYSDVAAVREGERSLTFLLADDDVVVSIELSTADNWGDDEGCA